MKPLESKGEKEDACCNIPSATPMASKAPIIIILVCAYLETVCSDEESYRKKCDCTHHTVKTWWNSNFMLHRINGIFFMVDLV